MHHLLLLLAAVNFSVIPLPTIELIKEKIINTTHSIVNEISPINRPLYEINNMLRQQASLNEPVINKVLTTLQCATQYSVEHNNILTIIDYSLPSNEKRLWVFNLKEKKLLFYTFVSHGIKSGTLLTNYFSNKFDSKASSIGVYQTENAYYGREGLSLRLKGLEQSFNDNASNRAVVMHGGWYVNEYFIKRYGRPGRSWGCPALSLELYQPIINMIKESSLLVAYYPSDAWFGKSKFLNCERNGAQSMSNFAVERAYAATDNSEKREDVLFANTTTGMRQVVNKPIVAMSADNYERIFHLKAPLSRMLRRQIDHVEYIALSTTEFHNLVMHKDLDHGLNSVYFVVPVMKMIRGYVETQMQIINMGKIKDVHINSYLSKKQPTISYSVNFEAKPSIYLNATSRFIRWLGL